MMTKPLPSHRQTSSQDTFGSRKQRVSTTDPSSSSSPSQHGTQQAPSFHRLLSPINQQDVQTPATTSDPITNPTQPQSKPPPKTAKRELTAKNILPINTRIPPRQNILTQPSSTPQHGRPPLAVLNDLELHTSSDGLRDAVDAAQRFEFEVILRGAPLCQAGFERVGRCC